MSNAKTKKELRRYYSEQRAQISPDVKKSSDFAISQALLNADFYLNAQNVLCYVSTDAEVGTRAIIADALASGKRVFVPKCTDQKGVMIFYRVNSLDELKKGKFGIPEPDEEQCEQWRGGENALCIVPALCCNREGNRLGYGGGYYDRFLSDFSGFSVCLCYKQFYDADFPREEHDIACNAVIKG